jgi:predicted transcriptional regulator
MLNVAATLTILQVEVSRETICGWLGIHPRGGSVGEELKALSEAGLVRYERGRSGIEVTEAGMAQAEQLDPAQAIEQAKAGLEPRQRRFFELIIAAYPESTTREAIAEHFQIHPRGGSLGEDLGRLVGRGLVEGERGRYRARDFLFATAS